MRIIKNTTTTLGESPIWHQQSAKFYWVDILGQRILSVDSDGEQFNSWQFDEPICAIVSTNQDRFLIALSKSLAWFNSTTGSISPIANTTLQSDREMFNDGYVDAKGRLWIATKDNKESQAHGKLYRYDGKSLCCKDEGFIVGNGIDWSLDNKTIYFTDSPKETIYAYDYNLESGELGQRRVFAKIDNGYPDGLCVDSQGHVWSAHWDGHGISQYDASGERLQFHELAAQRVTSCCFGGVDYQTLFITSAALDMPTDKLEHGHAFMLDNVSKGKPQHQFLL